MENGSERWHGKRFDFIWLLLWGVASSAWIVSSAQQLSATFDEPLYLQLGLVHWRTGSTHGLMRVGTMPLPVDVATFPIYVWERIRGAAFDPVANIDQILPVARASTLPFWWLLLILSWRFAREFGGPWAGRLAVAILACEPNLLAHAGLATTDIALTSCLLLFCWFFQRHRLGRWWPRVALPALGYAVAMLAKASALAFVPICALVLEAFRIWSTADGIGNRVRQLLSRRNLWDGVQIFLIATGIVYAYCGSDWQAEPSFVAWADTLAEGGLADSMRWCARNLRVFNNAGVAFARQIKHNMQGHGVYLLGVTDPRSLWYYYPAALAMKLPLPLLIAPVALLLTKPRMLVNRALLVACALLLFSLNCRVQIGVRLVLPIVVFACIGLAVALVKTLVATETRWQRRLLVGIAATCFGWLAVGTVRTWPDGLCYINEAWGGPTNAHRLLSDSNCDWGQGLPELAKLAGGPQGEPLCVWYFGTDPRVQQPPFHLLALHREPIFEPSELQNRLGSRRLAIGKTVLFGGYKTDVRQQQLLAWLRAQPPAAQTSTFLIFDFRTFHVDQAPATVSVGVSEASPAKSPS